jgi:transcriptional regulator with XRE-family HTH domain
MLDFFAAKSSSPVGSGARLDPSAPLDLGARLKMVREHNGLSQRELAKKSQVTHSSISMIEQGQNSPSISSLEKILSGIPMTLAQFFMCDPSHLIQTVYRADELISHQQHNGDIVVQHIPHQNTAVPLRFQKIILSAAATTGDIPLVASHCVSGYVISGKIEFIANVQAFILNMGDAFTLSANQAYSLRNLSTVEDSVLVVCEA